jgi:aquaporin Z
MEFARKLAAEFVGTFWLVFTGCGSAVLPAAGPGGGIGAIGISLAFGLTVLSMASALGGVSGAHFNPAVTVGLWAGGRFPARAIPGYVLAQVAGAIGAAAVLYLVLSGQADWVLRQGALASNGLGDLSPGKFSAGAGLLVEFLMTAIFVIVILGATGDKAPAGLAPIAIGLALTLIHLVSIPVTNTSVNPARSTGPALIEGGEALRQLWLFWLAPLAGGLAGGTLFRLLWGNGRT